MTDPVPPARIGRRALGRMLAATAVGAAAPSVSAQAPAPPAAQPVPPPAIQVDPFLRQALQERLDDAREIRGVPLPRTIEPAFRFKA